MENGEWRMENGESGSEFAGFAEFTELHFALNCSLLGFFFALKVPSVGSLGRKPEVEVAPTVIRFGGDYLGRRQSGVCGFAVLGILLAACRLFYRLIPCPFSMAFSIGDFEGHGEGETLGYAFGVQKLPMLGTRTASGW